ncbi:hypothetical protein MKW94_004187 [Papaver nudicaule]|uniref:G-patch domain-containing protein n=1 Tax=Papaver nudicaule TaxID=74823 RepID=A0AA41VWA8_PAPNU|nr:hypothetical protein [Papaver nudicaule]
MNKEIERRRQEEEEREREREQRKREAAAEREKDRESSESGARPASLNISGEEAWKRRAAMSENMGGGGSAPRSPSPPSKGDGGFSIGKSGSVGLGVGAGGQMTAAQKMMAKMGWKQGQGLGKQEQGITTPLMAKKTDKRAGVIVNASEPKSEKKPKSVNINGAPTRVLLLRNMVSIDPSLNRLALLIFVGFSLKHTVQAFGVSCTANSYPPFPVLVYDEAIEIGS